MNDSSVRVRGTYDTLKRAWLLTWEAAGPHARIKDRFAGLLSSRLSARTIERILEFTYVSGYHAITDVFGYVRSRKHFPYHVQYCTIAVAERMQKESSLPPQVLSAYSMVIGGNPWLWARVVRDLETWIDVDGVEHLRWLEPENTTFVDGEIRSEWRECSLVRAR
jgi:hypothetical protein